MDQRQPIGGLMHRGLPGPNRHSTCRGARRAW